MSDYRRISKPGYLEEYSMRTFVINLKRRSDRCARMLRMLPPEFDVEFTTDWPGPRDGEALTRESLRAFGLFPWRIESDNAWWSRPLRKGEIGCTISHWMCWRRALEGPEEYFLFLEDDVELATGAPERIRAGLQALTSFDPSWGLVYLGRSKIGEDYPACPGFSRPGFSYCTYAYVLSRAAIVMLLDARPESAIIPADEFLPAMYLDHPRSDVRRRFAKRVTAYAFEPHVARQIPKGISGSDTEASDFVDWT